MTKIPTIARKILGLNPVLMVTMYALLIFSIPVIESAARHLPAGGEWFSERQKVWILLGSVVYFMTALIDYRWMKWLSIPMYLIGVSLMFYVTVSGNEVHQISLGPISFQPTQLMIASGILLVALLFEQLPRWRRWTENPFVKLAIISVLCGIPFLLVVKSGDMGSALVWVPVSIVCLFIGGIPYRYLIIMSILGVGALPILYNLVLPSVSDRATGRIDQYIEMIKNDGKVEYNDDNYAIHYVTTAIGKAGWKGSGIHSTSDSEDGAIHANGFIPKNTAHNDYIFAVIGEELGFRGGFLLIVIFFLLVVSCLLIGFFSKDESGMMISAAVATLFFAHMFENIGMCIRIMPITGIPLPLISYSGTFTVICMFLLGFVQSIWIHRIDYSDKEKLETRRRVRMLEL